MIAIQIRLYYYQHYVLDRVGCLKSQQQQNEVHS